MNYIGSKYSLMPFLTETIAAVAGTDTHMSFADLFAGTGVVGKTFKEKGYSVIANDIQYYSYILNKHLIENVPPLDVQELLDDLPDYEVLGLADDEIDLQPALDLLAQRNREE